ncbi:accessory gene regulator B family protein [Hungatella hathewayi]|uniref:accessory gene regulator B family protein n=1 Tax=Hungatella hathewayi TaxID=154046 RepID=UPI0035623E4B
MLKRVAIYWTECMISDGIVERNREAIYIYGMELFLSTMGTVLSMILISILTDNFLNGILFLIVSMSLKMTANGYHAKTYFGCFLLTNGIFIFYIYLISLYPIKGAGQVLTAFFVVSVVYIYTKAPVEHPNHILTEEKRKKNRRYAHIILAIDCMTTILLNVLGQKKTVYSLYITVILSACIMMINKFSELDKSNSNAD